MGRQSWTEAFSYTVVDGTAIANSVTETLVWSPAPVVPNDYLYDARIFHCVFQGKYSTTGAPTIRFRFRYGTATGGVVLADSGTMTAGSGVTNALWEVSLWFTVRSNGSSGTLMCNGSAIIAGAVAPTAGSATGAPAIALMSAGGISAPATATCDFTTSTALSFTALWGTQSASNTLTGTNGYFRSVN